MSTQLRRPKPLGGGDCRQKGLKKRGISACDDGGFAGMPVLDELYDVKQLLVVENLHPEANYQALFTIILSKGGCLHLCSSVFQCNNRGYNRKTDRKRTVLLCFSC